MSQLHFAFVLNNVRLMTFEVAKIDRCLVRRFQEGSCNLISDLIYIEIDSAKHDHNLEIPISGLKKKTTTQTNRINSEAAQTHSANGNFNETRAHGVNRFATVPSSFFRSSSRGWLAGVRFPPTTPVMGLSCTDDYNEAHSCWGFGMSERACD